MPVPHRHTPLRALRRTLIASLVSACLGSAYAAEPVSIDIAPQPLAAAAAKLAEQSGLKLLYAADLLSGKTAPRIAGKLTPQQALERLLAGSGLRYQFVTPDAVKIEMAPADKAAELSPVEVRSTVARESDYHRPYTSIATKTDTPILQTATKVEVLTEQAIRDMGLQSQGMSQAMAALGIAGLGMGDLGDVYFYRGFQTSTTLWNGFRTEDMGSNGSNGVNGPVWMNNVERIELMRGASSILYGRAEPGGAVNITTKKPRDEFGGYADLGIGTHDRRWASFDVTGPLNADKTLLFRLNAGHEESDSWYTYGPRYRSDGFAPALEYRLSPQTKLYFEGQFRNVEGGSDQPYMPVRPGTNQMINVSPKDTLMPGTYSKFEQRRAMVGVDHKFNDNWSLTWKYMYNNVDSPLTLVNWAVGMYYPPGTPSGGIEWTRGLTINKSGQKTNATLLELTGKVETGSFKHTLLFGMDYYNTKTFQHAGGDCWCNNFPYFNPPPYSYNPSDFTSVYPSGSLYYQFWNLDEKEFGLYAQDQIQLPHDVHVLVGGRYQRQKELSKVIYPDFPDSNQDLPYKRNLFLPRFSVLWQPVSTVSLYYSYTENQGASSGLQYPGTPIKPEFSRQHELGAKFSLLESRLIASAALFSLTKENIATADVFHPGYNLGVGRVKSTGYELSLQGALTEKWNVLSTYNYARPYVEEGTDGGANSSQPVAITAGSLLPYFSQHSLSLLTSYRLPAGWKIGGGYNWFSAPIMDENSTVKTRDYQIASAFVAYETKIAGKKASFQMNVDNLFNEKYLLFQGDFGVAYANDPTLGGGYTGGNYVGGNWGQPRTAKLGMRVEF